MDWLKTFDFSSFIKDKSPSWTKKILWGAAGIAVSALLRSVANLVAPGISPYSFLYPACLLATLCAGWQSGVLTALVAVGMAEILVVPEAARNGFPMHHQVQAAIIALISAATIVFLAELFRASAGRELQKGSVQTAERDLFYRELHHRVGNNFAVVNNLLDLQRQKATDPAAQAALESAMGRIRSISQVHRRLDFKPGTMMVDMVLYLGELSSGLRDGTLPHSGVVLRCKVDRAFMRPDDALAIGLISNELVTNSVKHAFADTREGLIELCFSKCENGWQLIVADDGIGAQSPHSSSGLGTRLIQQLARQLGGQFRTELDGGTRAIVDLPLSAVLSEPV